MLEVIPAPPPKKISVSDEAIRIALLQGRSWYEMDFGTRAAGAACPFLCGVRRSESANVRCQNVSTISGSYRLRQQRGKAATNHRSSARGGRHKRNV